MTILELFQTAMDGCLHEQEVHMNRKDRIIISILVIFLCILVFRLGAIRFGLFQSKEEAETTNMEVVQMMSELENKSAYEGNLQSLSQKSEETSCSDTYLDSSYGMEALDIMHMFDKDSETKENVPNKDTTSEQIGIHTDDTLPEYSKLYPELYVDKICPEADPECEKIAYLTFDDGPSKNTLKILEILKKENAVATFFVLGSTITPDGEEALKEMVDMGCTIGIHTYSHDRRKLYSSVESFLNDYYQVYTQIYDITGVHPNIYRFPWGSYNSYSKGIKKDLVREMDRRGFTYYDWNVSAEDSVGKPSTYSIMRNIMKDVKRYNYPVILMHDSSSNKITVQTLPDVIKRLKELGYSFGTLDHREPCQFCW